jgi:DoxX-like protein
MHSAIEPTLLSKKKGVDRTPARGQDACSLTGRLLVDSAIHVANMVPGVQAFNQVGFPLRLALPMGLLEFVCVIVYVYPCKAVLGAIQLTGYLGGAVAMKLRVGNRLLERRSFQSMLACCSGTMNNTTNKRIRARSSIQNHMHWDGTGKRCLNKSPCRSETMCAGVGLASTGKPISISKMTEAFLLIDLSRAFSNLSMESAKYSAFVFGPLASIGKKNGDETHTLTSHR